MSLSFTATSQGVLIGGAAGRTSINAVYTKFTWLFWTIRDVSASGYVLAKGYNGAGFTTANNSSDTLRIVVPRATTSSTAEGQSSIFPVGRWACVGATYDESASPGARLYIGYPNAQVAELSSYVEQIAGSGATTADTGPLTIGSSRDCLTLYMGGRISVLAVIGRVLTQREMVDWQNNPRVLPGTVGFWRFGLKGTNLQVDESGYGNHGQVQGTTVRGNPVPIPRVWAISPLVGVLVSASGQTPYNPWMQRAPILAS